MTEPLKEVQEELVEYGNAICEMLGKAVPVFDTILNTIVPSLEKLAECRLASDNIRRKGRLVYLTDLIKAGATPEDAVSVIYREMELDHEGNSEVAEMLKGLAPLISDAASMLVMRLGLESREPAPEAPETPEEE